MSPTACCRHYWGQGLATEAALASVRYGFDRARPPTNHRPGHAREHRVDPRAGKSRAPLHGRGFFLGAPVLDVYDRFLMKFAALLFDLDGTLVDSLLDLCAGLNGILTGDGATRTYF